MKYENESIASYVLKKLNNFEMPSDEKISVELYERNRSNQAEQKDLSTVIMDQIRNLFDSKVSTMPNNSNTLNGLVQSLQPDQILAQNPLSQIMLVSSLLTQLNNTNNSINNASSQASSTASNMFFVSFFNI